MSTQRQNHENGFAFLLLSKFKKIHEMKRACSLNTNTDEYLTCEFHPAVKINYIRMKFNVLTILLCVFCLGSFAQKTVNCMIKTELGDIKVELYADKAPVTVANFLKYVDNKLYDKSSFFRVCTPENEKDRKIKIQVVQGGDIPEGKEFAPIEMETTRQTGIQHLDGTLSMARDTPDSATSSFSICVGDQPELNFAGKRNPDGQGFAAFGRVTDGMDVVHKIHVQKDKDQYLIKPVKILSIRRVR